MDKKYGVNVFGKPIESLDGLIWQPVHLKEDVLETCIKENAMTEQKPSDPVREMFDREIKELDNRITHHQIEVKRLGNKLDLEQETLNFRIVQRRAIIDAMQKVCNVVNKYPESNPVMLTEAFHKAADIESNTPITVGGGIKAKDVLAEIKRQNPVGCYTEECERVGESVLAKASAYYNSIAASFNPINSLGILAEPQKDFVVRFKCGCCVRWDFNEIQNPIDLLQTAKLTKCDMANGCYYDTEQVKELWSHREEVQAGYDGEQGLFSWKWETPK